MYFNYTWITGASLQTWKVEVDFSGPHCLIIGLNVVSEQRQWKERTGTKTKNTKHKFLSQVSSVAQSCPTLRGPMNRSTPGLPVRHRLPKFTQTHVYRVCDAIQPSHPLLSPSPPAPSPSQHRGLFQWVNSLHEVAKVLEFQWFPITLTGWAWHLLLQHCFPVSRRMGIALQQWSLLITREVHPD